MINWLIKSKIVHMVTEIFETLLNNCCVFRIWLYNPLPQFHNSCSDSYHPRIGGSILPVLNITNTNVCVCSIVVANILSAQLKPHQRFEKPRGLLDSWHVAVGFTDNMISSMRLSGGRNLANRNVLGWGETGKIEKQCRRAGDQPDAHYNKQHFLQVSCF